MYRLPAPARRRLITVNPLSVTFGVVVLGSSSAAQDVTVTNTGNADLFITAITIDNGQFAITSGNISGQTLAPGASATITLVFTPSAVGPQSGALTIAYHDSESGTVPVSLSGVGTESNIVDLKITKAASPETLDFADNLTYTLVVTNNGPGYATGVYCY